MENNALQHHGIKDMRWGIRRFQRKDGSLTALGRRRRQSREDNDESKKSESLEQKKQRILNSHSAKKLYENKDLFDNDELQKAFIRLNTENNIKKLMASEEVGVGKRFVNKYVDKGKTIKDFVDTSESLYNSYQKAKTLVNTIRRRTPPPTTRT